MALNQGKTRKCEKCGGEHTRLDKLICTRCRRFEEPTNCTCVICDRRFYEVPARIRAGRGKYCDRSCKLKGEAAEFEIRNCKRCGEEFKARITQSGKKWNKGQYCSQKCIIPYHAGKKRPLTAKWLESVRRSRDELRGRPNPKNTGPRNWSEEVREKCRKHRLSQTFLKSNTDIEKILARQWISWG